MKITKIEILSFVLILATFISAALVYPHMPEVIVTHWGLNNHANGHLGKFWGMFLLPTIMLACVLIFLTISRTDPKRENIEKFQKYFDLFVLAFILFFVYIYSLFIFWNLGFNFLLIQFIAPALAFLFYVVGIMFTHSEPNYSIGIRTPWTITNDEVWYKTHKLGGKLFKVIAFIALVGIIIPAYAACFVLIPVILVTIFLFVYSYLEYRKIAR